MRPLTEIIIHCTATRADWWTSKSTGQKIAEVKRWHLEKKWKDIGYHYLIDRNGNMLPGRPLDQVGAHTLDHNTGTIGISLFGGHGSAVTDEFEDNYTPEQEAALWKLISDLKAQYPTITKISGHNEYAAKACPGFSVPEWLNGRKLAAIKPLTDHGSSPWFSLALALLTPFKSLFGARK